MEGALKPRKPPEADTRPLDMSLAVMMLDVLSALAS